MQRLRRRQSGVDQWLGYCDTSYSQHRTGASLVAIEFHPRAMFRKDNRHPNGTLSSSLSRCFHHFPCQMSPTFPAAIVPLPLAFHLSPTRGHFRFIYISFSLSSVNAKSLPITSDPRLCRLHVLDFARHHFLLDNAHSLLTPCLQSFFRLRSVFRRANVTFYPWLS